MVRKVALVRQMGALAGVLIFALGVAGCGPETSDSFIAPPEISFIEPPQVRISDAGSVVLSGSGFSQLDPEVISVLFNGIAAPELRALSDSELEVVLPEGLEAGEIAVEIRSGADATARASATFEVFGLDELRISSFSPQSGSLDGGNSMSISGENFEAPMNVLFGNELVPADAITVLNSSRLVFKVPQSPRAGAVDVELFRGSDGFSALVGTYTYVSRNMLIDGFSPQRVGVSSDNLLAVYGQNFTPRTTVLVGDKPANFVEFVSERELRVSLPLLDPGSYALVLNDPEGGRILSSAQLTVDAPAPQPEEPGPQPGDGASPFVAGAVALDANNVLVSFSEAMTQTIEDRSRYQIFDVKNQTNLFISGVARQSLSEVLIQTLAQSNIEYTVVVSGVTDLEGNAIQPDSRENQFDRANFVGRSESDRQGGQDSDNDGLTDADEQKGRVINVTLTDGSVESRVVTSDPLVEDTDGDGFTDLEEDAIGSDPRRVDTDRDSIDDFTEFNVLASNPASQDSDGDGLSDSLEIFYKTSPILADSDGDQFTDTQEIFEYDLNPLIADLPLIEHGVSSVSLALDVRYSYETSEGQTVSSERTIQESWTAETTNYGQITTSRTTGSEGFFQVQAFFCIEGGCETNVGGSKSSSKAGLFGGRITGTGGATFYNITNTTTNGGSDSSITSAYNQNLVELSQLDRSSSMTKEVLGARATVALGLRLKGNAAINVENLELSLFQVSPTQENPGRLLPVAVLTPASGNLSVNLGPLSPEREGLIFTSEDIFPADVERLLRSPNLLVALLTNYNVVDEYGREFNFTEQDVFNKTAGFTIDYSNGQREQQYIAVTPTFDPVTGRTIGKSVSESLAAIGLVEYYPDKPLAELDREGADIQGTFGTQDGPNGRRVTRVRDRQIDLDNPDRSLWQLVSNAVGSVSDFSSTQVKARDQYLFVLTRDVDGDGLSALEEELIGTDDRFGDTDGDGLSDYLEVRGFGRDNPEFPDEKPDNPGWRVAYFNIPPELGGLRLDYYSAYSNPTVQDSDGDGLSDKDEYLLGDKITGIWRADPASIDTDIDGAFDNHEVNGSTITLSYTPTQEELNGSTIQAFCPGWVASGSGPATESDRDGDSQLSEGDKCPNMRSLVNVQDSDADRLIDGVERLLGLNPNSPDEQNFNDSDADGLRDSDDDDDDSPDSDGDGLPDLLEFYLRTSQTNSDSDGDGLSDSREWLEGASSLNGVRPTSAVATELSGLRTRCSQARTCVWPSGEGSLGTDPLKADTDGDGLTDSFELNGWEVQLDSYDDNGRVPAYRVTSDPRLADSDGDTLTDSAERANGTDPRLKDTDNDVTSDAREVQLLGSGRNPLKPDLSFTVALLSVRAYSNGETNIDGFQTPAYWSMLGTQVYTPAIGSSPIFRCSANGGSICDAEGDASAVALAYAIREVSADSQGPLNDSILAVTNRDAGGTSTRNSGLFPRVSDEAPWTEATDHCKSSIRGLNLTNNIFNGDFYVFDPYITGRSDQAYLLSQSKVIGLEEEGYLAINLQEYAETYNPNNANTSPENDYIESECVRRPDITASFGGIGSQDGTFTGDDILRSGRSQVILRQETLSSVSASDSESVDLEFIFELKRIVD